VSSGFVLAGSVSNGLKSGWLRFMVFVSRRHLFEVDWPGMEYGTLPEHWSRYMDSSMVHGFTYVWSRFMVSPMVGQDSWFQVWLVKIHGFKCGWSRFMVSSVVGQDSWFQVWLVKIHGFKCGWSRFMVSSVVGQVQA